MKITTAQRKKIKKETLAVLNKKFTETENDSGEKIPEDFKKIFNSFLTDIIPSDTSELIS